MKTENYCINFIKQAPDLPCRLVALKWEPKTIVVFFEINAGAQLEGRKDAYQALCVNICLLVIYD